MHKGGGIAGKGGSALMLGGQSMRVALVHDWLTGMRGGERVLEALLELFPDAEIFTLIHHPGSVSSLIESRTVHTSFVDALPFAHGPYRYLLPLFPRAVESFDLAGFDLVLSSSHCVAKGARPPPDVPHLCYCHTPMRYVWDQYQAYFGPGRASPPVRAAMAAIAPRLRRWDQASADRVDHFIANSACVGERIHRHYGRNATVVHPPVDVERFAPGPSREDFYLVLGALVPYKRVDLAVEAFGRLGRRLVIAGEGSEQGRLAKVAGPQTSFLGKVTDAEVADLLSRCRAFLLPGEEDFGITAVEAQAAGAPVIAYGKGGALETVVGIEANGPANLRSGQDAAHNGPRPTGVFFREPSPQGLVDAVERFESHDFSLEALLASAARFGRERFKREMIAQVGKVMGQKPT